MAYPYARLFETSYCQLPLQLLIDVQLAKESFERSITIQNKKHSELFSSWGWSTEQPISAEKLKQALKSLPTDIYRAKGICQLVELPDKACSLHLVGHRTE